MTPRPSLSLVYGVRIAAADAGLPTSWAFFNLGLEETVALDLVAPPAGPAGSSTGPPGSTRPAISR